MWCGQVDSPLKVFLLGLALLYVGLVLIVPAINVFVQVLPRSQSPAVC